MTRDHMLFLTTRFPHLVWHYVVVVLLLMVAAGRCPSGRWGQPMHHTFIRGTHRHNRHACHHQILGLYPNTHASSSSSSSSSVHCFPNLAAVEVVAVWRVLRHRRELHTWSSRNQVAL
jgi:hypothetical protein